MTREEIAKLQDLRDAPQNEVLIVGIHSARKGLDTVAQFVFDKPMTFSNDQLREQFAHIANVEEVECGRYNIYMRITPFVRCEDVLRDMAKIIGYEIWRTHSSPEIDWGFSLIAITEPVAKNVVTDTTLPPCLAANLEQLT
jgi:hypothetical protein